MKYRPSTIKRHENIHTTSYHYGDVAPQKSLHSFSRFGLSIFQHFAALGGQTHSHRKRENAYIKINKNEVNSVNLFSLRSVYFDYFDNTRSNNNFKETE